MTLAFAAVIFGLILLVWSADRFIDGAAVSARYFGMPPLLIGMVIVGFGTSAPEMVVSALAATQGNLGLTAVLSPIAVHSQVLRKELPILIAVTALAAWQLADGSLSRLDAGVLILVFFMLMGWTIYQGMKKSPDAFGTEMEAEFNTESMSLKKALIWLFIGLIFLIISSRILVWGAVEIAVAFGVSDLIIGLTIVAIGTSLPELASSLIAVKKGEHDIALGNVIGSNLFNTLAVVGIAGLIHPFGVPAEILTRDIAVMAGLTIAIFIFGFGFRGRQGRINRVEGSALMLVFVAYTAYLVSTIVT
jgi:cation:H+ antiporter